MFRKKSIDRLDVRPKTIETSLWTNAHQTAKYGSIFAIDLLAYIETFALAVDKTEQQCLLERFLIAINEISG
jgi:hypothetical protein